MTTLEIIFWGMACFWTANGTVQVMLPDGRTNNLPGVHTHYPFLWVRPADKPPVATQGLWPELPTNNFLIMDPCDLQITGLKATKLDTTALDDRLPSLKKADKNFQLADRKDRSSIVELTIDRGTLSAHEFPKGAIGVKWVVEVDGPVAFQCGASRLELDPATTQVTIANAARSDAMGTHNHFVLYRKLGKVKTGKLVVPKPKVSPQKGGAEIIDPPLEFSPRTPFVDCSGSSYP